MHWPHLLLISLITNPKHQPTPQHLLTLFPRYQISLSHGPPRWIFWFFWFFHLSISIFIRNTCHVFVIDFSLKQFDSSMSQLQKSTRIEELSDTVEKSVSCDICSFIPASEWCVCNYPDTAISPLQSDPTSNKKTTEGGRSLAVAIPSDPKVSFSLPLSFLHISCDS